MQVDRPAAPDRFRYWDLKEAGRGRCTLWVFNRESALIVPGGGLLRPAQRYPIGWRVSVRTACLATRHTFAVVFAWTLICRGCGFMRLPCGVRPVASEAVIVPLSDVRTTA